MNPITKFLNMDAARAMFLVGSLLIVTTPLIVIDPTALIADKPLIHATTTAGDYFWHRVLPFIGCITGVALLVTPFLAFRRK